jgi:LysR family nitrogen assimilation transcriptional regulator
LELKQLEYFIRVAELGSFTRASIALSITQPALSRKIRQLEVELHQVLFNRNGRGITLTDEGALVLEHSKGLIEQAGRLRNALHDVQASPAGRVAIALAGATGKSFAPGFVAAFRKRFPRASLEILEGRSRVIQEWLAAGRVDIGILYDPASSPNIDITPLHSVKLYLFSKPGSSILPTSGPVEFRALAGLPLILPAPPHSIRTVVEHEAAKAGIKLDVVLEVEGASTIIDLVQMGQGYSIQSGFLRQRNALELQRNEIVSPTLKRELTMAISLQRPGSLLSKEAAKWIQRALGPGSAFVET